MFTLDPLVAGLHWILAQETTSLFLEKTENLPPQLLKIDMTNEITPFRLFLNLLSEIGGGGSSGKFWSADFDCEFGNRYSFVI